MEPTCVKDTCEAEPVITRPVLLCLRHAGKVWQQMQALIAEQAQVADTESLVTLTEAHRRRPDIPLSRMEVWALRGHIKTRNGTSGQGGIYVMDEIEGLAAASVRDRAGAHDPVVYYVRMGDGLVKIGFTRDLYTRATSLYVRTSILAIEPGGRDVEAARHRQFAHLRAGRAEMFRADPDLMRHIAAMIERHGAPDFAEFTRASRLHAKAR